MSHSTIENIALSHIRVPLAKPVSDAKVLTGRQKPMVDIGILLVEITNDSGVTGTGFSYVTRTGGYGKFAHAKEIASVLLGEDDSAIDSLYQKLLWAGASVGRSGIASQAIGAFDTALWDLKARKAQLPLATLLGAHRDRLPVYNSSGGYLHLELKEVLAQAEASLERGIGGIKIKVGSPQLSDDVKRVGAVRKHFGDTVPIMVDANQQWDRATAMKAGKQLDEFNLIWIEEPVDAYDVDGHRMLSQSLSTPIATGEMLTSLEEYRPFINTRAIDILQPDIPRVGGVTPFLSAMELAEEAGLAIAPHFVMELHVQLAATYHQPSWIEHFEWLEPLFEERLTIAEGFIELPKGDGFGLTVSEQGRSWAVESEQFRCN